MPALDELSDVSQEVLEEELQLGEVLEEVDDEDWGFIEPEAELRKNHRNLRANRTARSTGIVIRAR